MKPELRKRILITSFDILFTAIVAYFCLVWSFYSATWISGVLFVVGTWWVYRGLCFTHELSHLVGNALNPLRRLWHSLFGLFFLYPHFTYRMVHYKHHSATTYGGPEDIEYEVFKGDWWNTWRFLLSSFVIPFGSLFRFSVLGPFSFLHSEMRIWVLNNVSAAGIRFWVPQNEGKRLLHDSAVIWEEWTCAIWSWCLLTLTFTYNYQVFIYWYGVLCGAGLVNGIRVIYLAHKYERLGESPSSHLHQYEDSIEARLEKRGWLKSLICPVGLSYHGTHHLHPNLAYYDLARAARLKKGASLRKSRRPKEQADLQL